MVMFRTKAYCHTETRRGREYLSCSGQFYLFTNSSIKQARLTLATVQKQSHNTCPLLSILYTPEAQDEA